MANISVNESLCKKDYLCTHVCPAGFFTSDVKDSIPRVLQFEGPCSECGHCVAICPTGAIVHEAFQHGSTRPVRPELEPSPEQIEEMLKTRRSTREFTDKPVQRDVIEKIIDCARFAPSACNCQSTEFTVVQDKALLDEIAKLTSLSLVRTTRQLRSPMFRTIGRLIAKDDIEQGISALRSFDRLVQRYEVGVEVVIWGAPLLLIFHGKTNAPSSRENAMLALSNASLTARALGLGDVCIGLIVMAGNMDKRIRRLLSIPDGNRVHGALALGYPRYKYNNWVDRRPARVKWF